jgi:bis(5'-nucleosyl)-tetraphosphatase (symmetrical)
VRWFVGDIHGCAREFEQLLETIRFDPHADELWSVGDLVNTGPDSLAALELWRAAAGRGVLGNHDAYALLSHSGARNRKRDTLDLLFESVECDTLIGLLRALPVLVHLPGTEAEVRDVWLVHAGLHPSWTGLGAIAQKLNAPPHDDDWLRCPDVAFATRARCCTPSGRIARYAGPPAGCPAGTRPWDDYYQGDALIVHGHWAQRGYYRNDRTMSLDSGCVYGGALTAWCQEEDRTVQIPSTMPRW